MLCSPWAESRRKLNIPHIVIFFWMGNMSLWFNNLLPHPTYYYHFPWDIIIHLSCPPQENVTPKWCSLLQTPQLPDIKKGEKKILFNWKAARKKGMQVKAVHNVQYVFRQCGGQDFFRKLLKWNFSSLSHMNKTGHIKWLKSSPWKKEDELAGACKVSELSLFSAHASSASSRHCILLGPCKHVNHLLLSYESSWRHLKLPDGSEWSGDGKVAPRCAPVWSAVTAILLCPGQRQPEGACDALWANEVGAG